VKRRGLVQRVLDTLVVLLGATLLTFALLHLTPGDPITVMLGERSTAEAQQRLTRELGLDQPLPTQYLHFLGRVMKGDLGRSLRTKAPVAEDLGRSFTATIELALTAMIFAVPLGILLGALAAYRGGGPLDLVVGTASVAGLSMPIFWLGVVMIQLFGSVLPFDGRLSVALEFPPGYPWTGLYLLDSLLAGRPDLLIDVFTRLLLPGLTLATIPLALTARMTRAAVIEELGKDYVRTARAKGLSERAVLYGHVLANASLPVVTAVGLQLGYLLSGAVLTERIFNWPGLGTYAVQAVLARDFPALQGTVLLLAVVFVTVNLVVDLSYGWLDPRLREGGH
jgi:peptide/nickel transport system permease protein